MFTSKELRVKAWKSLKGKYWKAFGATALSSVIMGFTTSILGGNREFVINEQETSSMQELAEMISQEPGIILTAIVVILSAYLVSGLIVLLLQSLVAGPLKVGVSKFFIKNTTDTPKVAEIFTGFKTNFKGNAIIAFKRNIKITLWSLLFIIPGIIKSLEYAMLPYILAENPGMESKEVFAATKKLMTGYKWKLFLLELSFIGWEILCVFTLGIGVFFLNPYKEAAYAEFYQAIKEAV